MQAPGNTLTTIAPDRLLRRSYPYRYWVQSSGFDATSPQAADANHIASHFDQARIVMMSRMLAADCWTSEKAKVVLAFHTIDYTDEMAEPHGVEAGGGVLRVGDASVTIAIGLFVRDRCIAVSESVLTHIGHDGHVSWSAEQRSTLDDPQWRYAGSVG